MPNASPLMWQLQGEGGMVHGLLLQAWYVGAPPFRNRVQSMHVQVCLRPVAHCRLRLTACLGLFERHRCFVGFGRTALAASRALRDSRGKQARPAALSRLFLSGFRTEKQVQCNVCQC